jgi:hypothetical protein
MLYQLKCDGGHGTTGSARWQLGSATISGTLQVRLGGKMTFYSESRPRRSGRAGNQSHASGCLPTRPTETLASVRWSVVARGT